MKFSAIALLVLLGLGLSSCDEDNSTSSFPTLEQYLEINNITEYETTDSGLVYVIVKEGTGEFPKAGQTVTVHYTGYHLNDTKFDSSYDYGQAFSFILGQGEVIKGWDEGIALFKKGGSGTIYVPHELAYGTTGSNGSIGPREDLKFDINLIAID